MLLNLSNHPSDKWGAKQRQGAHDAYGGVQDMPFPQVDPQGGTDYIARLAREYADAVLQRAGVSAVHIMGEQNFCFALITLLKQKGVKCVASTTGCIITPEGVPMFYFERFREY